MLDNLSIGSDKWKIKGKKGFSQPAFRFFDDKKDYLIEILISKESHSRSSAIVKKISKNKTTLITVKMNYK